MSEELMAHLVGLYLVGSRLGYEKTLTIAEVRTRTLDVIAKYGVDINNQSRIHDLLKKYGLESLSIL